MSRQQRNKLILALVLTLLCALMALVPFNGLEAQGKGVLIIFMWAILMWIVRPIPEYLVGVLAAAVMAIFFGMKANVVAGFSTSGWWLCLWAGFIGAVIKFSGLDSCKADPQRTERQLRHKSRQHGAVPDDPFQYGPRRRNEPHLRQHLRGYGLQAW